MDFSEDSGDHPLLVFKGKRSKRSRQLSLVPVTSTSSIGGGAEIYSSSTPTTSATQISSSSSEADEDMANCLILLAQSGYDRKSQVEDNKIGKISSRKFREVDTKTAGLYVYECKTCNRSFPSFQALGGHRTSHKKAKTIVEDKKSTADSHDDHDQVITTIPSISHNKPKIHECSICGAEFSSGQALGGHMRRHRPPTTKVSMSATCNSESSHDHDEIKQKSRIIFSLDLNLPAPPEDDHRDNSKFDFSANKETLVFSAATLVDCHY